MSKLKCNLLLWNRTNVDMRGVFFTVNLGLISCKIKGKTNIDLSPMRNLTNMDIALNLFTAYLQFNLLKI